MTVHAPDPRHDAADALAAAWGAADDDATRAALLRALGATPAEVAELLPRRAPPFAPPAREGALAFPLPDEPFVAEWARDLARRPAGPDGAWRVLRRRLPGLWFPIAPGVATSAAYVRAVRDGCVAPPADAAPPLAHPAAVTLTLHATAAGRIPVVATPHRADFEALLRVAVHRNAPVAIPAAQGATFVGGHPTWRAVDDAADATVDAPDPFAAERPLVRSGARDRLLVLHADAPYSGLPADVVGEPTAAWGARSTALRLAHESAHYLTRRVLGAVRDDLVDELLADHAAMLTVCGRYRPAWAVAFLGATDAGGARWALYGGNAALSPGASAVRRRVVRRAVRQIAAWARALGPPDDAAAIARRTLALASRSLEGLADPGAAARLRRVVRALGAGHAGADAQGSSRGPSQPTYAITPATAPTAAGTR